MNCVCGYKRRAKWLSASFPLLLSKRAFFCVIIRRLLFAFTENFIIKGSPSHEIFVLFPILLTASHHLQSKDEICVEFIKEYIVDCKSILFSLPSLNPSLEHFLTRDRYLRQAWHGSKISLAWQSVRYLCPHMCHELYSSGWHKHSN